MPETTFQRVLQPHWLESNRIVITLGKVGIAQAQANFIYPEEGTKIRADFSAILDSVEANVPGVSVGSPVSGSLIYDRTSRDGDYPVTNFTLSVGSFNFTFEDVLEGRANEFTSTAGFDSQVLLQGNEVLGDWSGGLSFEIFQEFGESNLSLSGTQNDFRAVGGLSCTLGNPNYGSDNARSLPQFSKDHQPLAVP